MLNKILNSISIKLKQRMIFSSSYLDTADINRIAVTVNQPLAIRTCMQWQGHASNSTRQRSKYCIWNSQNYNSRELKRSCVSHNIRKMYLSPYRLQFQTFNNYPCLDHFKKALPSQDRINWLKVLIIRSRKYNQQPWAYSSVDVIKCVYKIKMYQGTQFGAFLQQHRYFLILNFKS